VKNGISRVSHPLGLKPFFGVVRNENMDIIGQIQTHNSHAVLDSNETKPK
jgi:hypothetical protein